jgi:protein-histidine pros-kinase
MKLLVKFNLLFVIVMVLGLVVSGWVTRNLLQTNAQEEVLNQARLMMEKALAVRAYTAKQITPLLETQMKYEFLPQSVPSYSAVEVLGALQAKYPDFAYKEATLNPTNPRDRAVDWEVDIVKQFRSNPAQKETIGERETATGPSLFIARPLQITNAACLACHSSVDGAPKTMVARYGPNNGFGWQLNEIVGAQLISLPMSVPLQRADRSFKVFMASQFGVFLAVGLVLNLMIWLVIVRPVTRLSTLADQVSQGDLEAPDFATGSKDEIGTLAASFTRMRTSVVQAMRMLES